MQEQALGQLGDDPIANRQILARSGTLPLAQLGIGMQDKEIVRRREDIANQQAQANWVEQQKLREQEAARSGSYLTIAQQQEASRARKAAEDTRAFREQELASVGVDPKDPAYEAYLISGKDPPSIVQKQQAAKTKYELEQSQKYDTREKRLQAVKDGELDINDPTIRRWVALGSKDNEPPDITKGRLGLTPVYIQNNTTGEVKALQLRNDQPTETPEGWTLLGPGQIAQTKAAGTQLAKDQRALGAVETNADFLLKHIKETVEHPGKEAALGMGSYFPTRKGSAAAGFESRQEQLYGEAFSAAYETLRGAAGISEGEGKAATAALNRARLSTSVAEFDAAMEDFRQRITVMRELARRRAAGPAPAIPGMQNVPGPAPAAPTPAAPTNTHKNIPFTFTP